MGEKGKEIQFGDLIESRRTKRVASRAFYTILGSLMFHRVEINTIFRFY